MRFCDLYQVLRWSYVPNIAKPSCKGINFTKNQRNMESKERHLIKQYLILFIFFIYQRLCAKFQRLITFTTDWKTRLEQQLSGK